MVWIITGIIVAACIYSLIVFSQFVKMQNRIRDAFMSLDEYLRQRWEQAAQIARLLKENGVEGPEEFKQLFPDGKNPFSALSKEAKFRMDETVMQGVVKSMELAKGNEKFAQNTQFLLLCKDFVAGRSRIAQAAEAYNKEVRSLNVKREHMPEQLVARIYHIQAEKEM